MEVFSKMASTLSATLFFGVALTMIAFSIGLMVQNKFKIKLLNPIIVSVAIIIIFLKLTGIDYNTYNQGAQLVSIFLTPATVCLAVPLYEKLQLLKDNL
ncbi:MAG: LrgB family protein, partial [Lachnospiraceae bacterium]|nr:LrgB family protein [Lachnospiraceae bacterium]